MSERIIRAAVAYPDNRIFHGPIPERHHHCFARAARAGYEPGAEQAQGFLTDTGRFVNRFEAWDIARIAGQLLPRAPTDGRGGELYSEDVW